MAHSNWSPDSMRRSRANYEAGDGPEATNNYCPRNGKDTVINWDAWPRDLPGAGTLKNYNLNLRRVWRAIGRFQGEI